MNEHSPEQLHQRIKELEKQSRVLQKQLARSESNRVELENSYEIQSTLVSQIIQGLENARLETEARNQQLQDALIDLKRMQTKLVEAEKMSALGMLVAGIAHEINNPINFIHGNISHAHIYVCNLVELIKLYQEAYPNPGGRIAVLSQELDLEFIVQDLLKLLDSMQIGSDRIREIVLGLRTFSRLDEAEYKEADLHDGLESTLMLLQHRLKARGLRPNISVIKYYNPLPKVTCFPGQLNQVFMNILVNAIDAIDERYAHQAPSDNQQNPCYITITTSLEEAQWVKIAIADNGLGMSEEVRQKAFNPFFTTKPPGKGTGMGMSISYQIIVEKHGGKIDCFSTFGKGTEFILKIPIHLQESVSCILE